ncbi:MAG: ABC transporter substrate-binding protein [Alphaproteobacteria bacterium]|nr:ABC transporter substrate-binding protein [Alphaproteobacteria bacterium]
MKRLLTSLSFLLLLALPGQAQDTAVDDTRGAIDFIQRVADETIAVWSDAKMNEAERYQAFRAIFEDATDIELLARGMLGRHYRTASSDQRQAYMAAMGDYIIAEFDKRMAQIGFKTLAVTGTKPASGKHGHVYVKTEVERDQGEPILADWRVRKKDGKFQIVNLEFEGINLMITNRDVFASKVKDEGVDGLITWLKAQSGPIPTAAAASE